MKTIPTPILRSSLTSLLYHKHDHPQQGPEEQAHEILRLLGLTDQTFAEYRAQEKRVSHATPPAPVWLRGQIPVALSLTQEQLDCVANHFGYHASEPKEPLTPELLAVEFERRASAWGTQ